MTPNNDAKFEGKLTCAFKSVMRNLVNFHQSTQKSLNWDFDRSFSPKQIMHELAIYRGVMCHGNDAKFEE